MRSSWRVVLPILLLAATPLLAEEELNARQKTVLGIKAAAEAKNNVNRVPQGAFYFKWLTSAPPEWDKAYFKLGELAKGGRTLSLQLIRKTKDGSTELMILHDADFKLTVEDGYRVTARTLADADRAIAVTPDKYKFAVTGKEIDWFRSMIDQLKYDLEHQ